MVEVTIAVCIVHMPVLSSAVSTNTAFPVRSRCSNAASTPDASANPVWLSPNAGAGIAVGIACPGADVASARPARDQNDVASKPPSSANGPWTPRPVLRA